MYQLSAFGDEISPRLETQLEVLQSENIRSLEIRGVENKNVLDLTNQELEEIRSRLENKGFTISAIGSPIGKVSIEEDFHKHMKLFRRAVEIAKKFSCNHIRIFSFYIPRGGKPEKFRTKVIQKLESMVELAEKDNVILLHENEREIYGDVPERCLDLLSTINSAHLRATFDPANFVACGVKPFQQAFPLLADYIKYVHIKDARFSDQAVVPAGEGDGEWRKLLTALKQCNFPGYFSLEPHLIFQGQYSGYSGEFLFRKAAKSFQRLLQELQWTESAGG